MALTQLDGPTQIRTVFISSRMSLGRGRDAAYHALAGLEILPILFEREPDDKDSKRKMDWLLDTADFLVVIFDGSLGTPRDALHGMTPLEYEFWRFVIRGSMFESGELPITGEQAAQVSQTLDGGIGISSLAAFQKETSLQCISEKGPRYDLIQKRVRIFAPAEMDQKKIGGYIHDLPPSCFVRVPAPLEWQRHIATYQAVYEHFADSVRRGTLQLLEPGLGTDDHRQAIYVRALGQHEPGTLEGLLKACLRSGLNLLALQATRDESEEGQVEFELWTTPARRRIRDPLQVRNFLENIILPGLEISSRDLVDEHEVPRKREEVINIKASSPSSDDLMLVVSFLDVFGAFLEIVEIVSSTSLNGRQPNILSVDVLLSGKRPSVTFFIENPGDGCKDALYLMLYKLHSAWCTQGAGMHGSVDLRTVGDGT